MSQLSTNYILELLYDIKPVVKGKDIVATCPYCGKREFGVSLVKRGHPFNCYRKAKCGKSGTLWQLLKTIGKQIDREALASVSIEAKLNTSLLNPIVENNEDLPVIVLPTGFRKLETHPYLEARNFEAYQTAQPGTTIVDQKYKKHYIIFPIYQRSKLTGLIGRCIRSLDEIEYLKSKGIYLRRYLNSISDFEKMLYGIDQVTYNTSTIILVEGIFDKFNVDRLLKLNNQDEVVCLATFGAKITDYHLHILSEYPIDKIILMHDGDVYKVTQKAYNKIATYYNCLIPKFQSVDPGDMNLDQLIDALDNCKNGFNYFNENVLIKKLI